MGTNTRLLQQVSIFSNLDAASLEKLDSLTFTKSFPKDSLIVGQDEPGDSLFIIATGRVKVVLYGESGKEIILATFRQGDFFGEMSLLDGEPRSANVIAQENSELLILRRDAFFPMVREYFQIAQNIMAELSRRLRRADEIIGNLALLDVYGRVARILLELGRKEGEITDDGIVIRERPTQQDIASMVGTSRETVNRALNEFARMGYLEMNGRTLIIRHTGALESEYTVR